MESICVTQQRSEKVNSYIIYASVLQQCLTQCSVLSADDCTALALYETDLYVVNSQKSDRPPSNVLSETR